MGISSEQIHNVLRTYSRQLALGNRLKDRGFNPPTSQGDRVTISPTAQKEKAATEIPSDITARLTRDLEGEGNGARRSLEALGKLHNRQLQFTKNQNRITIGIINGRNGQVMSEVELNLADRKESDADSNGRDQLIRAITH